MPNWCANRLSVTGLTENVSQLKALMTGGVRPLHGRAEAEGIQLFLAGCAGLLNPVADEPYVPYPALTEAGHNEGKLTDDDIEKVAATVGAHKSSAEENALSDRLIEATDSLAEMPVLTGTPDIIVMPAEHATAANTVVLPDVVSEAAMQKAIELATEK